MEGGPAGWPWDPGNAFETAHTQPGQTPEVSPRTSTRGADPPRPVLGSGPAVDGPTARRRRLLRGLPCPGPLHSRVPVECMDVPLQARDPGLQVVLRPHRPPVR